MVTEIRSAVDSGGWGWLTGKRNEGSFWGDRNILYLNLVIM